MLDNFFLLWQKAAGGGNLARDVTFLNLQAITYTLAFNGGDTPVQGVMKDGNSTVMSSIMSTLSKIMQAQA